MSARGPSPAREQRVTVGPIHPNLSGRPSKSTYEAPPVPVTQKQTPEVPVESNYGYGNGYQNANAAYNSGEFEKHISWVWKGRRLLKQFLGYYGQYQNQNVGSMYGSQQAVYPAYQGQGASTQQQQWPQQFMPPLPMNSFASRDYGRHTALPLPTWVIYCQNFDIPLLKGNFLYTFNTVVLIVCLLFVSDFMSGASDAPRYVFFLCQFSWFMQYVTMADAQYHFATDYQCQSRTSNWELSKESLFEMHRVILA
jgi:hypothetical protein